MAGWRVFSRQHTSDGSVLLPRLQRAEPPLWRGRALQERRQGWSPSRERTSRSIYLPSQVTLLFQSTNAPLGLSRQAQTCSSKCAGKPYRFGLLTNWNDCPSSTGGLV